MPAPAAFTASNSSPVWSAPVNLGSAINSTASDQQPAISPDGLSLYFASNRTGGLGGFDMYVSQRASVNDPWGTAVNVGPLNTTFDEGNPAFSRDGRTLFFQSKRTANSLGGIDIWVSRRDNPHDDFGWQSAVNLGPAVNTSADDNGPAYFEDIARGTRQLYFGSTRTGTGGPGGADIYVSEQLADGSFAPATLVPELNSPLNENDPSIRSDGLEIIFQSNRTGSSGGDLWVATRASTLDPWSTPVNAGSTINTASAEQNAYLSSDGTTLFFSSDRAGSSAGLDLYVSTRTLPTPSWSYTGNLSAGRDSHTATLLLNGKVLVAGGNDSNGAIKSAELYDPITGAWSTTGSLNTSRAFHTATLLPDGKVLVVGGTNKCNGSCSNFNSAELYDPATGTWSNTGNLNAARNSHTATLLQNGKVLVVGGAGGNVSNAAELYDPSTGLWSITGSPHIALLNHTATLLPGGKVLVAGGINCFGFCEADTNAAELYDPTTGTWSNTGSLHSARAFHTASLLPNGKVLVAGGEDANTLGSAELYDPATETWSTTGNLNDARASHTATLLPNGKVLVVGGGDSTELYDPTIGTWSTTANLNTGRGGLTATLLLNGKVLAAGGFSDHSDGDNTTELYDPGTTPGANTVQFSAASYSANEGDLRATITVTRTGDTTGASSVSYRTVDDPTPVRCDVVNGTAYARCDYTSVVGTLTFAAGETTKTFTVPVIDDTFVEGTETFQVQLSGPTGAALGTPSTATVQIADNDLASSANPIDGTNFFVRQQYLDFLSREPDPAGFAAWVATINNCAAGDTSCDRVTVSRNFFLSQEFQLKGLFVFHFYKAAFGRMPLYSEIVADMAAVTGDSTPDLVARKAAWTSAFAQRAEFTNAYGGLTNQQLVDTMMGRYSLPSATAPNPATPDDSSTKITLTRADLVNRLNAGTITRAQALRFVADSDQVGSAEFNPAFVAMQYFGYLRRDPEAQGYADWLRTINANPSDIRSMVNGFVNSVEYRLRFGPLE